MVEVGIHQGHKENLQIIDVLDNFTNYEDESSFMLYDDSEIMMNEIMNMDLTNWRQVIVLSIIFVVGIITNGTILVIYWLSTVKQQRSFVLVINLAGADLIFLLSVPLKIIDEIYLSGHQTGWVGCVIYACLRVRGKFKF